jgi:G-patch domain
VKQTAASDVPIGKLLLQKMGWKEGEGLGKNNAGPTAPLNFSMKTDRRGKNMAVLTIMYTGDIPS